MRRSKAFYAVCIVSGLAWGSLATFVLLEPHQRYLFGLGWFFAPALGVLAGELSAKFKTAGPLLMSFVALATLYAAALLFGFSGGLVLDVLEPRTSSHALINAWVVPWGMTVGGYVLWLWPAAYINHRIVGRFVGPQESPILELSPH